MKETIELILSSRNVLDKFQHSNNFHIRIENPPYIPLVIEKHGNHITVTHYLEQNGDLIPNPDMEFEIMSDGQWRPVAIQFANGIYRRAITFENGGTFVNSTEMEEQIRFSKLWAKNLSEQGFVLKHETKR